MGFKKASNSLCRPTVERPGAHRPTRWLVSSPGPIATEKEHLIYEQHAQWYMALAEVFDGGPQIETGRKTSAPWAYTGPRWYELPPYTEGGGYFSESPIITVTEFYVTPFGRLI